MMAKPVKTLEVFYPIYDPVFNNKFDSLRLLS